MRRLTRFEYDNTVRDLLGDTSAPAATFPSEDRLLGFDNNAGVFGLSDLLVEQYEVAAERLARSAAVNLPQLLGCDVSARGEDACARFFIASFGLKAFRRPLSAEETARFGDFTADARRGYGFATAVRLLVQAFLQSPYFLYRVEVESDPPATGVAAVGAYERASRLSYLLWGSMPDQALFDAARTGELGSAEGVARQARRMLADRRVRDAARHFFSQWLDLAQVRYVAKDAALFSGFAKLRSSFQRESEMFAEDLIAGGNGTLDLLFRASHSFLNGDLAAFYGVPAPARSAFAKGALDPNRRSGILTQGALLASQAGPQQPNPVKRGLLVRERLLCAPPPPPPPNANIKEPAADAKTTTRERFAEHRKAPACAGCHALMDPIGLGFEHYDAVGAWRAQEAGRPIDATGEIVGSHDADGPFDGAIALGARLAGSTQVAACVARQWFRFGYGRVENDGDRCVLADLGKALSPGGGGFRELLVALTQTDPFLFRSPDEGGPP